MNKLILLPLLFLISCTKEVVTIKEVVTLKKPINSITLSIDSLNMIHSEVEDWFSVSTNDTFNMSTDFFHIDTTGEKFNLTPIVKRNSNNYYVTYELSKNLQSVILDSTNHSFVLITKKNEFGEFKVKLFKDSVNVFQYTFPFLVSGS
jgi:hypothetical protein